MLHMNGKMYQMTISVCFYLKYAYFILWLKSFVDDVLDTQSVSVCNLSEFYFSFVLIAKYLAISTAHFITFVESHSHVSATHSSWAYIFLHILLHSYIIFNSIQLYVLSNLLAQTQRARKKRNIAARDKITLKRISHTRTW